MLKIWRSPYSRFGVNLEHNNDLLFETFTAEKNYTDEVLQDIAKCGFNAIWLHGQLHHIIPNARFPELAPNAKLHQDALHTLCARAAKYGIKVYLYMQPPRALPTSDTKFWEAHADVKGQTGFTHGDDSSRFEVASLCISTEKVQNYLRESFADLAGELPELGGYIIISASEYPAHCYWGSNCRPGSNRPRKHPVPEFPNSCPRCSQREPEDVVVQVLQLIRDGVRSVNTTQDLIFWNWSWTMYIDPPCEPIISRLPKDVKVLADFERGGWRKDGVKVDEYSLGYAGPSELFQDVKALGDRYGLQVMPKFQLGTTHELGSVRSLPIMPSIFKKADYARKQNCYGFMGCWNFGNLNSTSIKAFNYFLDLKEDLSCDEALKKFALEEYPGKNADLVVEAWNDFARAMERHPFCIPYLYDGPVNLALSLIPEMGKLSGKRVGRSWLPDERGDVYPEPKEYPLEEDLIPRLKDVYTVWNEGVEKMRLALGEENKDYQNAAICGAAWESCYYLYRIYALKKNWDDSKVEEFKHLAALDLAVAERALPYVKADPEQGWHIEGDFRAFSAELVEKKIAALKALLA